MTPRAEGEKKCSSSTQTSTHMGGVVAPPRPGETDQDGEVQPATDLHAYEILAPLMRSSPLGSLHALMTSYSVVNRFMFFPPSESYGFDADGDTALLAMFAGAGARDVRRVYVPWTHTHPDGSGRTLGRHPLWMLHGGSAISCVTMSFDGATIPTTTTVPTAATETTTTTEPEGPASRTTAAAVADEDMHRTEVVPSPVVFSPATPTRCPPEADNPFLVRSASMRSPTAAPSAPPQPPPPSNGVAASANADATLPPSSPQPTATTNALMDRVVLAFHGNATDCGGSLVQSIASLVRPLQGPCTVLVVEYPGYGVMEGEPSEALVKCAAERVVQFVFATSTRQFTPSRLTLIAHSMGTAVALHVTEVVTEAFAPLRRQCSTETARSAYFVGALLLAAPFSSVKCVVDNTVDLAHTHPDYNQRATFEAKVLGSGVNRTLDAALAYAQWHDTLPVAAPTDAGASSLQPGVDGVVGVAQAAERGVDADAVAPDAAVSGRNAHEAEEDTFPNSSELPLLYRYGRTWMLDRFCSYKVVHRLQRDHACFSTTTLVLIHGTDDDVIPPHHSLQLSMAVAKGDRDRLAMVRQVPASVVPAAVLVAPVAPVYVHLRGGCDHNAIFYPQFLTSVIASLTTLRGLCSMPSSSCVILDRPSPTTEGLRYARRFFLSTSDARALHAAHVWFDWKCLALAVACIVAAALWVVIAAVLHCIYADSINKDERSHRVAVWGALECAALCGRAVGLCFEGRCSLSLRSMESLGGPSITERLLYYVLRAVASTLLVAVGLLLGACCALSASVCPSLHPPHLGTANGPTSAMGERWGLDVPRWTMAVVACLHGAQLVRLVLQHH